MGEASSSGLAVPENPEVSVVVPVYRNVETLRELHRRLCRTLEAQMLSFEVIFVDDACPAGSFTVLDELARRDSRVAVLVLERNVGQHRAVLAGLAHARGEWTIVMDADLQDPPEAIPDLLAKGREGYAAVFAGRRGRYESFLRLFTSRLFKGLLHLLCRVPADAGLFVALNRTITERLPVLGGPKPFVVAMIGCIGLPMSSVPVARARRPIGASAYSFRARLKSAWRALVWVASWRCRAIRRTLDRDTGDASEPLVKAFVGARFTQEKESLGREPIT